MLSPVAAAPGHSRRVNRSNRKWVLVGRGRAGRCIKQRHQVDPAEKVRVDQRCGEGWREG